MADVRVVLFDLDGVLVDVSGSYRRAIVETAEHFTGIRVDAGAIQALKNAGGFNDDWAVTAEIVARTGTPVPFDRIVSEFNRRYRGEAWDGLIASEPALVRSRELRAFRERYDALGLVTGRPREEAAFALERFGWTGLFDAVVCMEDAAGRGKPDPYPIELALSRLGDRGVEVPPASVAYVGDSVDDVRAALAAGCRPIGFVPPYLDPVSHAGLLRSVGAETVINGHGALADAVSSLSDGSSDPTFPSDAPSSGSGR